MARDYLQLPHDLLESLTPFGDAECGRLLRAALRYSAGGEPEEFSGNERFIWPTIKQGIDRARDAYAKKCDTNRANATDRKRTLPTASDGYRPQANGSETDKRKEKKRKEKNNNLLLDARARVMGHYMDQVTPVPPGAVTQELMDFADALGADVTIHAIDLARAENKATWSYIRAILQRYQRDGLDTMAKVEQSERAHDARRQKKTRPPTGSPVKAGDLDELDRLLDRMEAVV